MIVTNKGYMKLEDVLKLEHFSVYKTHKGTHILVKNTSVNQIGLWFPKKDRLPYKTTEGKKICTGFKVFDSKISPLDKLSTTGWNNGNQIMCYEEFCMI